MKIVVLSDTHIPERALDLPQKLYEDLKSADLILHAGDIASLDFYQQLKKKFAQLKAVQGNMDDAALKEVLPQKELIKADKVSLGLIHGWGSPSGLVDLVAQEFAKEKPDIIIFGHSHQALTMEKDGILFFNPGSPTDKVFSARNTYGIIMINDDIHPEVIGV